MSGVVFEDVVGFCKMCGIIRQDTPAGVPVTDCKCTALKAGHSETCGYVKSVACPIGIDAYCKTHQQWPCEVCECDCSYRAIAAEEAKSV